MSDGREQINRSSYFLNITGGWCGSTNMLIAATITATFSFFFFFLNQSFTAKQQHTLDTHRNLSLWQPWVSTATGGHTKINRDWVTSCLTRAFLFWICEPATRLTPEALKEKCTDFFIHRNEEVGLRVKDNTRCWFQFQVSLSELI